MLQTVAEPNVTSVSIHCSTFLMATRNDETRERKYVNRNRRKQFWKYFHCIPTNNDEHNFRFAHLLRCDLSRTNLALCPFIDIKVKSNDKHNRNDKRFWHFVENKRWDFEVNTTKIKRNRLHWSVYQKRCAFDLPSFQSKEKKKRKINEKKNGREEKRNHWKKMPETVCVRQTNLASIFSRPFVCVWCTLYELLGKHSAETNQITNRKWNRQDVDSWEFHFGFTSLRHSIHRLSLANAARLHNEKKRGDSETTTKSSFVRLFFFCSFCSESWRLRSHSRVKASFTFDSNCLYLVVLQS